MPVFKSNRGGGRGGGGVITVNGWQGLRGGQETDKRAEYKGHRVELSKDGGGGWRREKLSLAMTRRWTKENEVT